MEYRHEPVMLEEVLKFLNPQPGQNFIDCTLGGAGYTLAIAEKIDGGKILSIDLDEMAIKNAQTKIKEKKLTNIILANENFRNLSQIVDEKFEGKHLFSGIVLDLGLSGAQLEDRSRGFSFKEDSPLDMAFGPLAPRKTSDIVNKFKEEELARIIREYGEEKFWKKIAAEIIAFRQTKEIKTTGELVNIIRSAIPKRFQMGKIHPATRTFQALRIATNEELINIEEVLPQAVSLLAKGGRIVVVSFHSLEDRVVKHFFKKESKECLCPPMIPICQCGHKASLKIITPRGLEPGEREVEKNPRARSARMRVAEKII